MTHEVTQADEKLWNKLFDGGLDYPLRDKAAIAAHRIAHEAPLLARIAGLEAVLSGLVQAVTQDANEPGGRGISGFTGARLSDARAALKQGQ